MWYYTFHWIPLNFCGNYEPFYRILKRIRLFWNILAIGTQAKKQNLSITTTASSSSSTKSIPIFIIKNYFITFFLFLMQMIKLWLFFSHRKILVGRSDFTSTKSVSSNPSASQSQGKPKILPLYRTNFIKKFYVKLDNISSLIKYLFISCNWLVH